MSFEHTMTPAGVHGGAASAAAGAAAWAADFATGPSSSPAPGQAGSIVDTTPGGPASAAPPTAYAYAYAPAPPAPEPLAAAGGGPATTPEQHGLRVLIAPGAGPRRTVVVGDPDGVAVVYRQAFDVGDPALREMFVDAAVARLRAVVHLQQGAAMSEAAAAEVHTALLASLAAQAADVVPTTPAGGGHGRPVLANSRREERQDGDKAVLVDVAQTAPVIADQLEAITRAADGQAWPKRLAESLFVAGEGHRPVSFTSATQLFGWIDSFADVDWRRVPRGVTQERFYEYLRQHRAERFEAIERLPHWPPMAGTFYMHPPIEPRSSRGLIDAFLDHFSFATAVDRSLALAAVLTTFWGGPPGARPAFRIDADDEGDPQRGRSVGKSTFVEKVALLCGGYVGLHENEDIPDFKRRLLSGDGAGKRVVRLDNVKTLRFSWAALEEFITSDTISGHRMYHGEGQRPNTLAVFITINGGSFSKDMASRIVPIRLRRPPADAGWRGRIDAFIEANRWGLIAEVLGLLAGAPVAVPAPVTRWGQWDRDVLGKAGELAAIRAVIAERVGELDADDADAEMFEEHVAGRLKGRRHDPDRDTVRIPSAVMGEWWSEYKKRAIAAMEATTALKLLLLRRLQYKRTSTARYWLWMGREPEERPLQPDVDGGPSGRWAGARRP